MKKLKLKALELGANEILSREQLKNVLGGDDGSGSGGPGSGKCRTTCATSGGGHTLCNIKYLGGGTHDCECPTNPAYACH